MWLNVPGFANIKKKSRPEGEIQSLFILLIIITHFIINSSTLSKRYPTFYVNRRNTDIVLSTVAERISAGMLRIRK